MFQKDVIELFEQLNAVVVWPQHNGKLSDLDLIIQVQVGLSLLNQLND